MKTLEDVAAQHQNGHDLVDSSENRVHRRRVVASFNQLGQRLDYGDNDQHNYHNFSILVGIAVTWYQI